MWCESLSQIQVCHHIHFTTQPPENQWQVAFAFSATAENKAAAFGVTALPLGENLQIHSSKNRNSATCQQEMDLIKWIYMVEVCLLHNYRHSLQQKGGRVDPVGLAVRQCGDLS